MRDDVSLFLFSGVLVLSIVCSSVGYFFFNDVSISGHAIHVTTHGGINPEQLPTASWDVTSTLRFSIVFGLKADPPPLLMEILECSWGLVLNIWDVNKKVSNLR